MLGLGEQGRRDWARGRSRTRHLRFEQCWDEGHYLEHRWGWVCVISPWLHGEPVVTTI